MVIGISETSERGAAAAAATEQCSAILWMMRGHYNSNKDERDMKGSLIEEELICSQISSSLFFSKRRTIHNSE
jgi:hypothetical protein